jgi:serine protease Do
VGFSVPVNLARYVMERLIADGKVTRGYLGILIQPLTPELAKEFKLADDAGALVGEVSKNSPAEQAGLREGDVVTEFNGRKVVDSRQLRLTVAQTAPGTQASIKILRDGKPIDFTVRLGELTGQSLAKAGMGGGARNGEVLDGVTVDDLDLRVRQQFNIPTSLEGALVTKVEPNSAAARVGLTPGDVILEINRQRVTNADEAVRVSRGVQAGRVLLRVWSRGGSRYLVIQGR